LAERFEVLEISELAKGIFYMKVEARLAVKRALPGQFIILRVDDPGERIPLTIMDHSADDGTLEMVFQVAGTTTEKMSMLAVGDRLADVVGPLGRPTEIEKFGRVACVGGGVGTAALYPIARAMSLAGNEVRVMLGAKDRDYLILMDRFEALDVDLKVATDDGSAGLHGFVTELVLGAAKEWKPDRVVAIGPLPMMRAVSVLTKEHGIPTVVSLNSIMLDGTGMCGTCRCEVDGKTKFACVDGPEFDGHLVDFDVLSSRLAAYKDEEKLSLDRLHKLRGEKITADD